MKQITVAIAGLGSRGLDAYARYADEAPDEMKIVAVADILPDRVERAAKKYNAPAMPANSVEMTKKTTTAFMWWAAWCITTSLR